jgi:hypothetical protein
MRNVYENVPSNQIEKQKRYLYGSLIDCLYKYDEGYPMLDARIQTLINQVLGSNELFGFQAEVLTIVAFLETARREPSQFRKCILDAANLVDMLKGGDSNV